MTTDAPATASWQPSGELSRRLYYGVLGVIVAAILGLTASILDLSQPKQTGLTASMLINFAAIVPQFIVLRAFLGLARETDSDCLKRSSIGIIGAAWLFQVLGLLDETILNDTGILILGLSTAAAGLFLAGYCVQPWIKQAGLGVVLLGFAALQLTRLVMKAVPALRQLDPASQWLIVLGCLALFASIAVSIWFGVTLIGLREKLGGMAAVAGWGHLASVVGLVGVIIWFVLELLAAARQPGAFNKELDDLIGPQLRWMSAAGVGMELLTAALTGLLFLSVRRRATGGEHEVAA